MRQAYIPDSIINLHKWLSNQDYTYYSLNSLSNARLISFLCRKSKFVGLCWRQLFRISPINLRKLFRQTPPALDSKAAILLTSAYMHLMYEFGHENFDQAFNNNMERVMSLSSSRSKHFAVRQGTNLQLKLYDAEPEDISPLLTCWAGGLFVAAYNTTGDTAYANYAHEVAHYFIEEHPREATDESVYFYYEPSISHKIYNASCEISSYLIQYGSEFGDEEARELGLKGIN